MSLWWNNTVLQDIICRITMWVIIYDPFASNLGIDNNWNQLGYPWIFIVPLPFSLYVESFLCNPKFAVCSYTDCITIEIQLTRNAVNEVLYTTSPNWSLTFLQIPNQQNIMRIGCPLDWYTAFSDSYLYTISNTLSLNLINFNSCNSPWFQL